MFNRALTQRLLPYLLLMMTGCASVRVDVTGDRLYTTDYREGQILRLKQDLTLERPGGTLNFSEPRLRKPAPSTVGSEGALGVVAAGTTLRITRLVRGRYPGLESWGEVFAEIRDGPYRGRRVEITAVSRQVQQQEPAIRMPWVNPELLKPVEE